MERCRGEFPVVLMSRVLSVSRAGFYAWCQRQPSAQAERRAAVGEALEQTYYRCKRRYGAPRLAQELTARGMGCSTNYVAKLLRARRLKALNGKGFRYVRAVESMTQVRENVLARDFASGGPTASGSRTSPTSGWVVGGRIWRWCWICSHARWWVGRWTRTCASP